MLFLKRIFVAEILQEEVLLLLDGQSDVSVELTGRVETTILIDAMSQVTLWLREWEEWEVDWAARLEAKRRSRKAERLPTEEEEENNLRELIRSFVGGVDEIQELERASLAAIAAVEAVLADVQQHYNTVWSMTEEEIQTIEASPLRGTANRPLRTLTVRR